MRTTGWGLGRGQQEVVVDLLSHIPFLSHSSGLVHLSALGLPPLAHPPRSQDLPYTSCDQKMERGQ